MDNNLLRRQAEMAIAKIENSQLLTGELIRLGVALGKGKLIESVVESKNLILKVEVKMNDGSHYWFC